MKKVVLAYSGGLDTSVCIPLLREHYGYDDVIAVTVDVGQSEDDIKEAKERGEKLREENADAVAHGCTGKGNDQLRFDAVFRTTDLDVVAPMRELSLTRAEERKYAAEHGILLKPEHRWSVDENIWSRSMEGAELEEPSFVPPEEIFQWTVSADKAPEDAETLKIDFVEGVPVSLNGTKMDGVSLLKKLNETGGKHGIGRTDIIEDRVLGFKSRENYEHPAATILLVAHRDLEQLVLTRNELRFKDFVDSAWSERIVFSNGFV